MTVTLTYRRLPHRLGMRWGCTSRLMVEPADDERAPQNTPLRPPVWSYCVVAPAPARLHWVSEYETKDHHRVGNTYTQDRLGINSAYVQWPNIEVCIGECHPYTWWVDTLDEREAIIAWLVTLPDILVASYQVYLHEQLQPWLQAHAAAPGDDEDTVIVAGPAVLKTEIVRPRKRRHIQVQQHEVAA